VKQAMIINGKGIKSLKSDVTLAGAYIKHSTFYEDHFVFLLRTVYTYFKKIIN